MTAPIPNLPPDPPAIVEQAQELMNDLSDQYRINEEISRQTDNYPAQGTNQPR